jgi:hypothetical protein
MMSQISNKLDPSKLTDAEREVLLTFACDLINRADDFTPETNVEYLENSLGTVESFLTDSATRSVDSTLPPRTRAYYRDKHQNALGLLNGMKFALSFLFHKDVDLRDIKQTI